MIIGISGFKGSGKSIASNIFIEYGFEKMSCASPLKDIVSTLFLWPRYLLEGDTKESREWREYPSDEWQHLSGKGIFQHDDIITPRIVLQRIGTDLFRENIHDSFWIDNLLMRSKDRNIIIDDACFLNELSICDYTINIVRDIPSDIDAMHKSETEHMQHTFDYIVYNTSTISSLQDKISNIISILSSKE